MGGRRRRCLGPLNGRSDEGAAYHGKAQQRALVQGPPAGARMPSGLSWPSRSLHGDRMIGMTQDSHDHRVHIKINNSGRARPRAARTVVGEPCARHRARTGSKKAARVLAAMRAAPVVDWTRPAVKA